MFLLIVGVSVAKSQSQSATYLNYIETFKEIAVRHQQQYGIPASITLAQGLLESSAGLSVLATNGNNHFGIKCHKEWKGEGIYHDDDEAQECFRKYENAAESYEDHARFLKRTRYKPLFELRVTDYKEWATTLRKCGYATDPRYPEKLISIIERYELFRLDSGQPIIATPKELKGDETLEHAIDAAIYEEMQMTHKIRRRHGLHYVTAHENDSMEAIAKELGIKEKKIRAFNDIKDDDYMLKKGEIIYIEEKGKTTNAEDATYTTKRGETLHEISQRFGIRLKELLKLNDISSKAESVKAGTKLILR